MQVVPASAYRRMPWKNGSGETIEIAASPEGASLDAFDWRVSMARVDSPGPFSIFPGIDRTLVVLDGTELVLHFENEAVHLTPDSTPHAFPADVFVTASLTAGGITDLNVMTRRGRVTHQVERRVIDFPTTLACDAETTLVLVRGGAVRFDDGASEREVADGDTLVVGPDTSIQVTPSGRVTLFIAAFRSL